MKKGTAVKLNVVFEYRPHRYHEWPSDWLSTSVLI